jgi:glycerophosphoryl diester phosphodiesterase
MAAFEAAFEIGCDGVELDVQLSKDKQWIIYHDSSLGGLSINKTELAVLIKKSKEIDIELATLREVLDKFQNNTLNLEIKPSSFEVGVLLGKFFKKHGNRKYHYITSFKPQTLFGLKSSVKVIRMGYITHFIRMKQLKKLNSDLNLYTVNPLHNITFKHQVYQLMNLGVKIQPWTVNSAKSIEKFINLNVDSIITDKPKLAISVRDRFSH